MLLARVRGRATSTVKHPSLRNQKLLVCVQLDSSGEVTGDPMLVIDQLGAGAGETVIISSDGRGLRDLIGDTTTPARWFTIGIADPTGVTLKG
ncbi:MAG: ethanolamine utilization protein EutN [Phycisphaera sp.]|nr:ethanolamine utilization protein EutN [Phycisphaera sp.]